MNYKPAATYELLLIQANALNSLVSSLTEQRNFYMKAYRDEKAKKRHVSQCELDSEREANHQLTIENERLRRQLDGYAGHGMAIRCGVDGCGIRANAESGL